MHKAQSFCKVKKIMIKFFFFKERIAMNGSKREEGVQMEECQEIVVYMCGYMLEASPEKSPILSLVSILLPSSIYSGDSLKDFCGGGWWFPMAISSWIKFHILSIYFVVWMCLRFWSWTPRFDPICSSSLPFIMVWDVIDYIKGTHLIYVLERHVSSTWEFEIQLC